MKPTHTESPVLMTACRARKDIGYYCVAEAYEHWLDVKVYKCYLWCGLQEAEWDGVTPLTPGESPAGYAFHRAGARSSPDPVYKTNEAEVFLSGSIKWDGCSNLRFDHQDRVMLHFCGKQEAMDIGILLGWLYELAAEMVPAFDESLAE